MSNRRAVSLIERLVVLAIIAVLIGLLGPAVGGSGVSSFFLRIEIGLCVAQNPSRILKDCAMARSSRETARTLVAKALDQGGYFTAKQGREAGYDYSHLD